MYDLYDLSWHGVDVSVYKAQWPTIWHESAVCTDCHGIHNIRTTEDPASTGKSGQSAGHLPEMPSRGRTKLDRRLDWAQQDRPERTPVLYYTDVFYSSFTPVVLWLSIIYVLLQILHAIVDRVRRSLS